MRRDVLLFLLVFIGVSLLCGFFYFRRTANRDLLGGPPQLVEQEEVDPLFPEEHPPIDVRERRRELREQVEANPGDSRYTIQLADFLFEVEQWEEAAFWYRRALELEPKNTDLRSNLGMCYHRLGRFDEAITAYTETLVLERNKPEALYGLALTRLQGKQDVAGAQEAYEQLRLNSPEFPGLQELSELLQAELERP